MSSQNFWRPNTWPIVLRFKGRLVHQAAGECGPVRKLDYCFAAALELWVELEAYDRFASYFWTLDDLVWQGRLLATSCPLLGELSSVSDT